MKHETFIRHRKLTLDELQDLQGCVPGCAGGDGLGDMASPPTPLGELLLDPAHQRGSTNEAQILSICKTVLLANTRFPNLV